MDSQNDCRYCFSRTSKIFSALVIEKYKVDYFKCQKCCSVQTEFPYWLDEAYGLNETSDSELVNRNFRNFYAVNFLNLIFNFNFIFDFGGGPGLLTYLLNAAGISCSFDDRNYPNQSLHRSNLDKILSSNLLITIFEVAEHFIHPFSEWDNIFNKKPTAIIGSTLLYKNQNKNWWYFGFSGGTHVFFYSKKAFTMLARNYGYSYIDLGNYFLFVKEGYISYSKLLIIKLIFSRVFYKLFLISNLFLPRFFKKNI